MFTYYVAGFEIAGILCSYLELRQGFDPVRL